MNYRLGKLAAHHDPRTLRLADYLDRASLPAVPKAQAWSGKIDPEGWGILGNDRYGDCGYAGPGHQLMAWTSYTRPTPFVPTTDQILAAYAAGTGFDPATGANDNGTVLLNMLKQWRSDGIAGHRIDAFANINPHDTKTVATAIFLFGGVTIGLDLPQSAQIQLGHGQSWTVARGFNQPGGWGGHCVIVTDYDPSGLTCVTWGALQRMDWRFFTTYCDECWAPMSLSDWAPNGISPSGLNTAALRADLQALAA